MKFDVNADALYKIRKRRRLSQHQLAKLAHCTQTTIHYLENGKMRTCSPELGYTIARQLGVPWQDIFTEHTEAADTAEPVPQ